MDNNPDNRKNFTRRDKFMELLRYLLAGVLTTAIDYGVTALMKLTGEHAWLDSIVAWIVSVVFFAFWMYKLFVFRSKSMRKKLVVREFVSFVAARLFTLGFQTAFMWLFVDMIGFNGSYDIIRVPAADGMGVKFAFSVEEYWIFKIAATVGVTILNYVASKLIIFKVKKKEEK